MNNTFLARHVQSFLALLIFALIIILFLPVREFEFLNFDDNVFIINNPHISSGLSTTNIRWAFLNIHAGQWQPLTWISHMCDVAFFGMNAGSHHFTNILLHAFTTLILFAIGMRLTGRPLLVALISFAWGIHPMRLESIAWVAERKDVLSIFFGTGSLLAYLNYQQNRSTRKSLYFLSLTLFLFGLLSKPIIITLPILFVLIDRAILSRKSSLRLELIEKGPFILLMLVSAIITVLAQRSDQSLSSLNEIPIDDRISMVAISYLAYAAKFFWPSGGGIFYPAQDFAPGIGAGALLGLISLVALSICYRIKFPEFLFAVFWLIISLLPVIGLIHVGGQALADRWTYLPHLGLSIALMLLVVKTKNFQLPVTILLLILTVTLTAISNNRLSVWRNSEAIFSHTLKVLPNNFMAHTNLGAFYDQQSRLDLATPHFEEAARLNPNYPEALNNLGSLRARQGRMPEAIELFQKALLINPNFESAKQNLRLARGY